MTGRCGSCRWWGPNGFTVDFPGKGRVLAKSCNHPQACVFAINVQAGKLDRAFTVEGFGCVQWEAGAGTINVHDGPGRAQ